MRGERARDKLARARANLSRVEENTPETFDEFRSLGIVKDGVYKNLEDAIRNLLDVCALLVKANSLGVPDDDEGLTDLLLDEGRLDPEDKRLLDDLRGLRNRLVHRYGTIDDSIVHARIRDDLARVRTLAEALGDRVDGEASPPA